LTALTALTAFDYGRHPSPTTLKTQEYSQVRERRTMTACWGNVLQFAPAAAALLVMASEVVLVARAVMELH
jgi:hypothetical protein